MDFVTVLTPLLGLAFLIERFMEAAFNIVEQWGPVKEMKAPTIASDATDAEKAKAAATAARYASWKQVTTFVVGVGLGMFLANSLQIPLLTMPAESTTTSSAVLSNYNFAGLVAGVISPFAHQILEGLLHFQKLLEEQKKSIAEGKSKEG